MIELYDNAASGNAYKVRLLLAHLGIAYRRIDVSVTDRSNRSELLGDKNPAQRIPVLRLEGDRHLAESNAILCYLAEGTSWLPDDRYDRALVLQWLFFEQYEHEPAVAVARYLLHYAGDPERQAERIARCQKRGRKAIRAMEGRLDDAPFLVGDSATVADIALYAYTHVADEAGIDLGNFPAVTEWIERIAALPGHVRIDD